MALSTQILRSYRAPRSVLRALLAQDRHEGRALFYLMLACALIFLAQWPRLQRLAQGDGAVPFEGLMAGALFGWLFVAPILFYGLGALMALVLRLVRPSLSAFGVRLALFWALLAVSPLVLVQSALVSLAGPGVLALVSGLAVLAAFVAILLAGLRAALEAGASSA